MSRWTDACTRLGASLLATAAGALMLGIMTAPAGAAEGKSALADIQQRGILKVAFYKDFAPYSDNGKGIDVDLAEALAAKLGVKMSPLWFDADENMDDDLRNMVWKGHYLGYGPADVMMHVPIDAAYMAKVDQVKFLAPYQRERYAIGRDLAKIENLDSLEPFATLPFAVEGDSLAATVMLSADSGRYRENLKAFKTTEAAIAALKAGSVAAVIAQEGELEAGLHDQKSRYAIELPPEPILQKRQWVVGLAVKSHSDELAQALQKAIDDLTADGTVTRIMQRYGVEHRKP
jgi:ABC-type amino acid transport substrate-binding protein